MFQMVNTRQAGALEPMTPTPQKGVERHTNDIPGNRSNQEEGLKGNRLDRIGRIMESMTGVIQGMQHQNGRVSNTLDLYCHLNPACFSRKNRGRP